MDLIYGWEAEVDNNSVPLSRVKRRVRNISTAAAARKYLKMSGAVLDTIIRTHLQFKVVSNQLFLLSSQIFEFSLIVGDLLPHHTGRVPTEPLPLPRQFPTLLSVIVQEAAEIPQLLVVLGQPGVEIFEASDLSLQISHLLVELAEGRRVPPGLSLALSLLAGSSRVVTLVVTGGVWRLGRLGRLVVGRGRGVGRVEGCWSLSPL